MAKVLNDFYTTVIAKIRWFVLKTLKISVYVLATTAYLNMLATYGHECL
jgi:hypothetical protein